MVALVVCMNEPNVTELYAFSAACMRPAAASMTVTLDPGHIQMVVSRLQRRADMHQASWACKAYPARVPGIKGFFRPDTGLMRSHCVPS